MDPVLLTPPYFIYAPWILWFASWILAAGWASTTVNRPALAREAAYRVFQIAGFVCLLTFSEARPGGRQGPFDTLFTPLWPTPDALGWAMIVLAVGGFAFCWWARLHLGRLWSASVTRKEDHRVVDSGPYAVVRHPIYTGLLIAAIATAVIKATPVAFAGAVLLTIAFVVKGRLEENFLREELGREAYDAYRKRVPMLVPFAPTGG